MLCNSVNESIHTFFVPIKAGVQWRYFRPIAEWNRKIVSRRKLTFFFCPSRKNVTYFFAKRIEKFPFLIALFFLRKKVIDFINLRSFYSFYKNNFIRTMKRHKIKTMLRLKIYTSCFFFIVFFIDTLRIFSARHNKNSSSSSQPKHNQSHD